MGYFNGFNVAPVGRAGGLSLWWDDSVKVEIVVSLKHFIDDRCSYVDSQCVFRFTGVYGTAYRAEKLDFWRGMIQKFSSDNIAWLCGDDFNEFLWDHEKLNGAEVRYNRLKYLEEFMTKLEEADCREVVKRIWENPCERNTLERWNLKIVDAQHLLEYRQIQTVRLAYQGDDEPIGKPLRRLERRMRNKLASLKNDDEEWVDNPSQRDWGAILNCITPTVSDEMNVSLINLVSVDEIKDAAMQMGGLKASGPDGFQGIFYHSYWDTIDEDVNDLIGNLMYGAHNPNRINVTHVVLILKVQNPESV
ncbi:hypothetical protein FF1_040322 [Malus domestica]